MMVLMKCKVCIYNFKYEFEIQNEEKSPGLL